MGALCTCNIGRLGVSAVKNDPVAQSLLGVLMIPVPLFSMSGSFSRR